MRDEVVLILCAVIIIGGGPSASEVRGRQADDCTSGFMSLDRIEAVVEGSLPEATVQADLPDGDVQVVIPDMNFICAGSILSWTFGAQWEGNSPLYTELQIWRSSGDGSYTKVESTTIKHVKENTTRLYQCPLTSPLPFQKGDILGYFQGSTSTSQLNLLYEATTCSSAPVIYYMYAEQKRSMSEFIIQNNQSRNGSHVLINVETDSAGCDCGFMSVERMRILLGIDIVGDRVTREGRQQITPAINFTCDGLITKWIVGAAWGSNHNSYPELQIWRNTGNDIYHKINGTLMNIANRSKTSIYEYEDFPPIPFLTGDILGILQPRNALNRLRVWSEDNREPTNYYILTDDSATKSSFETFDLQRMSSLMSLTYHPLVTVEITLNNSPSSSNSLIIATTPPATGTSVTTTPLATSSGLYSTPHTGDGGNNSDGGRIILLSASGGVAGVLLTLITATLIIITVVVFRRKRRSAVTTADNVAYLSRPVETNLISNEAYTTTSTSEVELTPNAAYTATNNHTPLFRDDTYVYIRAPATAEDTETYNNEAYYDTVTSTNEACYDSVTSTNDGTGVSTSTNQDFQASICQSGICDFTYDYVAELGN